MALLICIISKSTVLTLPYVNILHPSAHTNMTEIPRLDSVQFHVWDLLTFYLNQGRSHAPRIFPWRAEFLMKKCNLRKRVQSMRPITYIQVYLLVDQDVGSRFETRQREEGRRKRTKKKKRQQHNAEMHHSP